MRILSNLPSPLLPIDHPNSNGNTSPACPDPPRPQEDASRDAEFDGPGLVLVTGGESGLSCFAAKISNLTKACARLRQRGRRPIGFLDKKGESVTATPIPARMVAKRS